MKQVLRTVLAVVILAGCTKKTEPTPDQFLGNWQADSYSYSEVDATGKVYNPGATIALNSKLVVTAATLQFTVGTGNAASVGAPIAYTRNGDVITLGTPSTSGSVAYVRSLTPATFTYELTTMHTDGSVFIMRYPYHR